MITIFESSENMIFNGVDLAARFRSDAGGYFLVNAVRGREAMPEELEVLTIPDRAGGVIASSRRPVRILDVEITLKGDDRRDLRKKIEDLNALLYTNEEVPIEFADEPDRVYYGRFSGTAYKREVGRIYQAVLTFICPDPYKYGPELEAVFPSDIVTLTNNGTAEAEPIFELEVKEPVTFAMIQNQDDEYMMIGELSSITQQPAQEKEPILFDGLGSTAGWTVSDKIDDGVGNGQFIATQGAFVVSDYGTGSAWHGPAVYKQLNESLENYRIELTLEFKPVPGTTGRVELYLLGPELEKVGKLTLRDTWKNSTIVVSDIEIGGTIIDSGPNPTNQLYWNNFYGIMMLEKRGNQYTYYTTLVNQSTGRHYHARGSTYYDVTNSLGHTISAIQLHAGQYGNDPPVDLKIHDLKVYKINNLSDYQVPYIAEPGDIVTFDHKNADILINGESRADLKQLGASFFKLKKGENRLVVSPADSFDVKCRYRPTYL